MKKPEELLANINNTRFARAFVISIAVHAVVLCLSSIALFADWCEYGVHSPSYINAEKAKARREAEDAKRREQAAKKAADEQAKTEKAAPAATNVQAKAAAPETPASVAKEEKAKTPPEIKPLPRKESFEYGEDLTLD